MQPSAGLSGMAIQSSGTQTFIASIRLGRTYSLVDADPDALVICEVIETGRCRCAPLRLGR